MLSRCCPRSYLVSYAPVRIITRSYRTKGSKNAQTLAKEAAEESNIKTSLIAAKRSWKRPATINHGSEHHQDLTSFLAHAKKQKLSTSSPTYQGTLYEYVVGASLARHGFDVCRTGKTADQGIDLLGWWHLDHTNHPDPPIKVLLQCKNFAAKLGPRFVRELEGSFPSAPAHWQGIGVMGFLVAPSEATKGMRDALVNSRLPLGFMQVTREGRILQMLWNEQAKIWGLQGYGVTVKHETRMKESEIALTWEGRAVEDTSGLSSQPSKASGPKTELATSAKTPSTTRKIAPRATRAKMSKTATGPKTAKATTGTSRITRAKKTELT